MPQYTLAALRPGVYVLGMKEQFTVHELPGHPLDTEVQFVADEMGFVLLDRTTPEDGQPSIDRFGPYHVEQYLIMHLLSKQACMCTIISV